MDLVINGIVGIVKNNAIFDVKVTKVFLSTFAFDNLSKLIYEFVSTCVYMRVRALVCVLVLVHVRTCSWCVGGRGGGGMNVE